MKKLKPATPSDAKAAWESMQDPSTRKVSAKLKAAGLSASNKTVGVWHRAGWPGTADPAKKAEAGLDTVAAQVTGNPGATLSQFRVPDSDELNSAMTMRSLRATILTCERLTAEIYRNMEVHALAPDVTAGSIERITKSLGNAANELAALPRLREGEMKDVTAGSVEIKPPTRAELIEASPFRASLLAYGKAIGETP